MKVAAVQFGPVIGDKPGNLKRMFALVRVAARQGAECIVLPECALTGYCFDNPDEPLALAEPIPGAFTDALGSLTAELGVTVIAGIIESSATACFNSAVVSGPQGLLGRYRKAHLPCLALDRYASPGNDAFNIFAAGTARTGVLICYDLRFPEAARVLAIKGADVIALPTNWPSPKGSVYPDFIVRARACENRVFIIAANRVGVERGQQFIGRSQIVDPAGTILAEGDASSEQIVLTDISVTEARNKVVGTETYQHDIMKDRRPDLYGGLQ